MKILILSLVFASFAIAHAQADTLACADAKTLSEPATNEATFTPYDLNNLKFLIQLKKAQDYHVGLIEDLFQHDTPEARAKIKEIAKLVDGAIRKYLTGASISFTEKKIDNIELTNGPGKLTLPQQTVFTIHGNAAGNYYAQVMANFEQDLVKNLKQSDGVFQIDPLQAFKQAHTEGYYSTADGRIFLDPRSFYYVGLGLYDNLSHEIRHATNSGKINQGENGFLDQFLAMNVTQTAPQVEFPIDLGDRQTTISSYPYINQLTFGELIAAHEDGLRARTKLADFRKKFPADVLSAIKGDVAFYEQIQIATTKEHILRMKKLSQLVLRATSEAAAIFDLSRVSTVNKEHYDRSGLVLSLKNVKDIPYERLNILFSPLYIEKINQASSDAAVRNQKFVDLVKDLATNSLCEVEAIEKNY